MLKVRKMLSGCFVHQHGSMRGHDDRMGSERRAINSPQHTAQKRAKMERGRGSSPSKHEFNEITGLD